MGSWWKSLADFFGKIFTFGRRILSEPFFDHVFAIAGLIYPPAAPIIDAVDLLFEQDTREGFVDQLDQLLTKSGLDTRQADIVKHLVSMLLLGGEIDQSNFQNEQKATLTREILKTAIAANIGEFRA